MKTKDKKQALVKCLETTPIISVACQKICVSRSSYYRWYEKDKSFREIADKKSRRGKLFVNDLAKSQLINQIKKGNITAIIFWLKFNDSDFNENKIYFSNFEQREFLNLIRESDIKSACGLILEKFFKGEFNKNTALSLISIIKNIYPKLNESSVNEEIKETIRKLNESDEQIRQLVKTTQQDLEVLPLMT
jgi:hypothetical protein